MPFLLLATTYYSVHRAADRTILRNEVFGLLFQSRHPHLRRFDELAKPADERTADFCVLLDQAEMFKSK